MEVEVSIFLVFLVLLAAPAQGYWCVARSDAGDDVLQAALDYACTAGADCTPILSAGLCFLPNTLQAHASYAFNSFYQRKNMAPGACQFGGAATLAKTDPSYGSCVYPPNPSTAGMNTTTAATTSSTSPPVATITGPYGLINSTTTDGGSGSTPSLGPPIPTTTNHATASLRLPVVVYIMGALLAA